MAECFWPGVTEQKVKDAGARGRRAAQAVSSQGGSVRYVGSIFVPSDEIALCLFEATSLDEASEVNQRAAIPFERILEIVRLDPERTHSSRSPSDAMHGHLLGALTAPDRPNAKQVRSKGTTPDDVFQIYEALRAQRPLLYRRRRLDLCRDRLRRLGQGQARLATPAARSPPERTGSTKVSKARSTRSSPSTDHVRFVQPRRPGCLA